jgi:hypothetical protein
MSRPPVRPPDLPPGYIPSAHCFFSAVVRELEEINQNLKALNTGIKNITLSPGVKGKEN